MVATIANPENLVYSRPKGFTDTPSHYCPGCTHGTAHRLVAEVLEEMNVLDKAIGVVLKAMDNQGFADDTIRKMKITLTELLVNALHHGNKKDPLKKVILGHIVDKNKSVISILDEGDGFNPSVVPDPTLPENLIKDSGRGLYIVRCYVDDLYFNEKGNRVTIVKRGTARR